jgi:uncharacterized protein
MHPFLLSLLGGAILGVGAVVLMATIGRIAGISSIAFSNIHEKWRWAFVIGLIAAPVFAQILTGSNGIGAPVKSTGILIIAAIFVGVGTALSNGCTSGHGVCGLSRFSIRSLVATLIFMGVAIVTVALTKGI